MPTVTPRPSLYTYENGRLVENNDDESTSAYTAWDSQDRPTGGQLSTADCAGAGITLTYDDPPCWALETYDTSVATGNCPDGPIEFSTHYDANGNLDEMRHWIGIPDESLWTFHILGTALVCHFPP